MARNEQKLEREIQRIEGQLLVAKQICRENLKEINRLKHEHESDSVIQETNRLLSLPSLHSKEHADQFNQLLQMISERQNNTEDTTIQSDEEYNNLLSNLSSNVTELESLFNYAKNLFTQPITSVNTLDHTLSLQDITHDSIDESTKNESSIDVNDLQHRIDAMQKQLSQCQQSDDCTIQ